MRLKSKKKQRKKSWKRGGLETRSCLRSLRRSRGSCKSRREWAQCTKKSESKKKKELLKLKRKKKLRRKQKELDLKFWNKNKKSWDYCKKSKSLENSRKDWFRSKRLKKKRHANKKHLNSSKKKRESWKSCRICRRSWSQAKKLRKWKDKPNSKNKLNSWRNSKRWFSNFHLKISNFRRKMNRCLLKSLKTNSVKTQKLWDLSTSMMKMKSKELQEKPNFKLEDKKKVLSCQWTSILNSLKRRKSLRKLGSMMMTLWLFQLLINLESAPKEHWLKMQTSFQRLKKSMTKNKLSSKMKWT